VAAANDLPGTGSSKPLDETSYESPALADSRIVIFIQRNSEPIAVISAYLLKRRGQPLRVHASALERDDGKTVAEHFQSSQGRLIVVLTRPEILTPKIFVANLMRH
jgi:hypothetical protein